MVIQLVLLFLNLTGAMAGPAPASVTKFLDCGQSAHIKAVNLSVPSDETAALIATCPATCGLGGCGYFVFIMLKGAYQPAGEFFGVYAIERTSSHGFMDIRVKASMGSDFEQTFLLKFNGQKYE